MDLVVFTNSFPQPGETVFGTKFQMSREEKARIKL